MIKKVRLNYFFLKTLLVAIGCLSTSPSIIQAMQSHIVLQDNEEVTCKITVLKATGEPQKGVYAKIFGNYSKFEADENGVITLKYSKDRTYSATLYFNDESEEIKKDISLHDEQQAITVYFDRLRDVIEYKRTARLFPLEGMVVDSEGNPIEGATVSVQGTGRNTFTDEMGLFKIDGDFNHSIIIRANGMDNISLPITQFFQDKEDFNITMQQKNEWDVYASAEKMPEFPGGMKAFQNYLNKNLIYPKKAEKAKKEGVVVVQFIVETNGHISNPQIARHLEESMDSAAWRLIKNMPSWIPASDFGTKVRCKYSLPVAFRIPKERPVMPADSLHLDSLKGHKDIQNDSLHLEDSTMPTTPKDSLYSDSLIKRTMQKEQIQADSLQQDITRLLVSENQPTVKKHNAFVRFFRWLFGIERRQRKRAEKSLILKTEKDSINSVDSLIKDLSKSSLKMSNDSIRLDMDSLNLNVKGVKTKLRN